MKKIEIYINSKKHGLKMVLIDSVDYELVSKYKWHVRKGINTFYAITDIYIDNKRSSIQMHRLIAGLKHGDKREVDHEDHDGLNNQRNNLRLCTNSQNNMNQRKMRGSSKYKGVCWYKRHKKWLAKIMFDNKLIHLGYFNSQEEAAQMYDKKAKELFGQFAKLNFSKGEKQCMKSR